MIFRLRGTLVVFTSLIVVVAASGPATAQKGLVLDGFGGVHAVNGASSITPATPYFGFDVAESIQVLPGGQGYYVLDAFGGLHKGGTAPTSTGAPYFGFDIARDFALIPSAGMSIASPGAFTNSNGSETRFQSLFGTSFSGTAIGAGNLFPTACTARNLFVTARSGAGTPRQMVGSESVSVNVMINEFNTGLACTIGAGVSQCTSAASVNVTAGARVGFRIVSSNLDVATNGSFYVHKGFTCS